MLNRQLSWQASRGNGEEEVVGNYSGDSAAVLAGIGVCGCEIVLGKVLGRAVMDAIVGLWSWSWFSEGLK